MSFTGSSIFPPIVNGVIICWVEIPVVTTSAIIPLPGLGSSPTPLDVSLDLDTPSVYILTHAAVDTPTFIREYVLNPVTVVNPVALSVIDVVDAETVTLF